MTEPAKTRSLNGTRAATNDRLLNACSEIIIRSGFKAVSMSKIAEEAGLTRQTVYRYFKNKRAIITATIGRAAAEVLEAQYQVLRESGEPRDIVIKLVLTSLHTIRTKTLFIRALESGGSPQADMVSNVSLLFAERSIEALRSIGDRVDWDEQERREVNEILVRYIMSYLIMPHHTGSESALRADLYKRMVPALGL
ncbi:MAG: TetR/AcrR family transcriptional regulator [Myxococcota bacterium]